MGYFNNQTGYPTDILSTRAIIKRGNYALIRRTAGAQRHSRF